jgi:regulator of sigma E protease
MKTLFGILVALVLIGIIAAIHELGHYLTGRRLGFKVISFQIFVGPTLFRWKRGEVEYSLNLIPLGAAVNFAGEYEVAEGEDGKQVIESTDPAAFGNRPKAARAAVLLAGPLANLFAGVLAFFIAFAVAGYQLPILAEVLPGTQAAAAGLQPGDRILSVNGTPVATELDVTSGLMFRDSMDPSTVIVERGGQTLSVELVPQTSVRPMLGIGMRDGGDGRVQVVNVMPESNRGQPVLQQNDTILAINGEPVTVANVGTVLAAQGFEPFELSVEREGETLTLQMRATEIETVNSNGLILSRSHNLLQAIPHSFRYSWSVLRLTGLSLGKLFVGELSPQETLSGPVGIVSMISDAATQSHVSWADRLLNILWLFALISLSLGFTNLLPIPLLDGNRLLLIAVEAIRGKRLSYRAQSVISAIGIVLILSLFAFVLYTDIARLMHR